MSSGVRRHRSTLRHSASRGAMVGAACTFHRSPSEATLKLPPFQYHRAFSAEEAIELLAELGDEAKILAGGQSLIPLLSFRLARPSHLIDVNAVAELAVV